MKLIVLLVTALLLAGCTMSEKVTPGTDSKVMNDLTYARDPNTGLCYALVAHMDSGQWTNGFSITWVPCEPLLSKGIIK